MDEFQERRPNKASVLFATVSGIWMGALGGWAVGDLIRMTSSSSKIRTPGFAVGLALASAAITGFLGYRSAITRKRECKSEPGREP